MATVELLDPAANDSVSGKYGRDGAPIYASFMSCLPVVAVGVAVLVADDDDDDDDEEEVVEGRSGIGTTS